MQAKTHSVFFSYITALRMFKKTIVKLYWNDRWCLLRTRSYTTPVIFHCRVQ